MKKTFEYDNLIGRKGGKYLRLGAKVHRGIRSVQQQIPVYAHHWRLANQKEYTLDKPLWVVLGDSMAQGIGASTHDRGWVGILREALRRNGQDYRLLNLSISGARIADVLERQLPALHALHEQPALITVMIGSNDLVRKKYRRNALENFDTLLEHLPEGSVVANLLGNHGVPLAMDMRLQRAVQDRHLVLADLRTHAPASWRKLVSEDYFHPNETGYAVISRAFERALGLQ